MKGNVYLLIKKSIKLIFKSTLYDVPHRIKKNVHDIIQIWVPLNTTDVF